MKEHWKHIIDAGHCPEMETLILYHNGKIISDERFIIENHLANCEQCNDVLEGMSLLNNNNTSLIDIENDLKQRIDKLLNREKYKQRILPVYRRLMIAASILLLVGVGFYMYTLLKPQTKYIAKLPTKNNQIVNSKLVSSKSTIKQNNNAKNFIANSTRPKYKPANTNSKAFVKSSNEAVKSLPLDANSKVVYSKSSKNAAIQVNDTVAIETIALTGTAENINEKEIPINANRVSYSGQRVLTGIVKDQSTGGALPGVNVVIKGTTKGTVTDINGEFSLNVQPSDKSIVVSYIGYKNDEIALVDNAKLDINLTADAQKLDEVVVIGYGVQKKSSLTGSISKIFTGNNKQVEEELQGKSQGVSVARAKEIESTIDTLKFSLKSNPHNSTNIKLLAEKYIELKYQNESIEQLNNLQQITTDPIQINQIKDIIELVINGKYNKALKKLKKIRPNLPQSLKN